MSVYIGVKLKQLRLDRFMSQADVADKLGTTRSAISNYEIGRRTPHLKDLQRLANVFGVGLDYFGVYPKDDAIDLLERAKELFHNPEVDKYTKEELYMEFTKLYLEVKKANHAVSQVYV